MSESMESLDLQTLSTFSGENDLYQFSLCPSVNYITPVTLSVHKSRHMYQYFITSQQYIIDIACLQGPKDAEDWFNFY